MDIGIKNAKIAEGNNYINLDLKYLNDLSGGDKNFVSEIIEMFIHDVPEIIEQTQDFLLKHDFDLLRITVHKLKSSVQVLGGHGLVALIQEIESQSKDPEIFDVLVQKIARLKEGLFQMVDQLKKELTILKS